MMKIMMGDDALLGFVVDHDLEALGLAPEASLLEAPAPEEGLTVAPYLAFVLTGPVTGLGAASAWRSVGAVHGALVFRSPGSTRFLTGPVGVPPAGLDLTLEAVLVEVDGQVTDSATGAAVLGDPARVLPLLSGSLSDSLSGSPASGRRLEAGQVVLSGPLTAPVPVTGVPVAVHFTHLGSLSVPASDSAGRPGR